MRVLRFIVLFCAGFFFTSLGIIALLILPDLFHERSVTHRPLVVAEQRAAVTATFAVESIALSPPLTPLVTPASLPAQVRQPVVSSLPLGPPAIVVIPIARIATANREDVLYGGPGSNFDMAGSVFAGQSLTLIGVSQDGLWYQLKNGRWIASYIVDSLLSAPVEATPQPSAPQVAELPTRLTPVPAAGIAAGTMNVAAVQTLGNALPPAQN